MGHVLHQKSNTCILTCVTLDVLSHLICIQSVISDLYHVSMYHVLPAYLHCACHKVLWWLPRHGHTEKVRKAVTVTIEQQENGFCQLLGRTPFGAVCCLALALYFANIMRSFVCIPVT